MRFQFVPIKTGLPTAYGTGTLTSDLINAVINPTYFVHRAEHYDVYDEDAGSLIGRFMCMTSGVNASFNRV